MSNCIKAGLRAEKNDVISRIDKRVYGSFVEHLGRAIYTGIYEPGHPAADENGFRKDVIEAVKELNVPMIRYPGGNFVSGYNWEDGIGPKTERKTKIELAWFAKETNQVGVDDFADWLKAVESEMMLAVNLGTRGPADAQNLVEYCNFPEGTYYSDLRRSYGHEQPHAFKLWCLGNEMDGPWQICHKTAEEYGRTACEAAKLMKWVDPSVELVVCGSSGKGMPTYRAWEETVLRHTYEYVDYVSLHTYYGNRSGNTPEFLALNTQMDEFIKEVAGICRKIKEEKKSEKDVYLSFDEWNVWYHSNESDGQVPKWQEIRPILEDRYTFEDALLVGGMLNTLLNNADVVKVACLAQLINVIAPIMTVPGGLVWKQTIFYPFKYASNYGRGIALKVALDCPGYACSFNGNVPYVDASLVYNDEKNELVLFAVNRSLEAETELVCDFEGFDIKGIVEQVVYENDDLKAANSAEMPEAVIPKETDTASISGGKLKLILPMASWNMVRLTV